MRRTRVLLSLLFFLVFTPLTLAQVPPPDLSHLREDAEKEEPATPEEVTDESAQEEETSPAEEAPGEPRIIVIGSAPVSGTFYPAAGAICREVNRLQEVNGLRCLVEETDGSAENLQRLAEGTLDLAIVQSDWVYHAANGSAHGFDRPFHDLRALLLLQPQVMTLVAGAESEISTFADLPGKRLSIGPAGSGVNGFGRNLLNHLGGLDVLEVEMPIEAQVGALCQGEIDAFLIPVAHPNGTIAEALDRCGAVLISITGEEVDQLVSTWPFYAKAKIPAGTYSSGDEVESFGLVNTLVTTEALSEDDAYAVLQAVFKQLDDFRIQHPTLHVLTAETMSGTGFSAPLHAAAERFYQDMGLR